MRGSRRRAVLIAAAAICLASTAVGYGGASQAATPAAYTVNDPRSAGAITFYDALGTPTTGGGDLTHIADFAQGSSSAGGSLASMAFALVRPDVADPQLWPVSAGTTATAYPDAALGASVTEPSWPTAAIAPAEGDLASFLASVGAAGPVLVEARLMSGDAHGVDPSRYWSSVIAVDPTAGTWSQRPQTPLATAAAASAVPVSISAITPIQAAQGVPARLTATIESADGRHPDGTARLFDGGADLGQVSYSGATGQATATPNLTARGAHRFRFAFAPASTTFSPASSPVLQISSSHADFDAPRTGLVVLAAPPSSGRAYDVTTLSAWLTPASVAGTVQFTDSLGGDLGSAKVQHGTARLLTNSLGAGRHLITAQFTPESGSCASMATATAAPFTLAGGAQSQDGQAVTANVPAGQLTITTPYTPAHPFDLGSLVLNAAGSKLQATAHFGSSADAATTGITVNDSRAGNQPWTASVAATNFLHGSDAINAQNIGFVNIRQASGPAAAGSPVVTTYDLPPATQVQLPNAPGAAGLAGPPKAFASVARGGGTTYLYGDVVLNAPTGTPPGAYNATLTFTVG